MTEKKIPMKRGKPNKRISPHHTNPRRQEIQTREIKSCTTITQIETSSALAYEMGTLEVIMERMEALIQE